MRITILLRFPRVERSSWKRKLIQRLLDERHDVSLIFGEASVYRHARAALREYGPSIWEARGQVSSDKTEALFHHFRSREVAVHRVGDLNGARSVRLLRRLQPDIVVLLGTGIIRRPVLEVPAVGTIHCHQGYLPSFRGVNTIEWSIYHGHAVYITTHFVDPGIDTGRILHRQRIPLHTGDTIAEVRERCKEEAVDLLARTVRDLDRGTLVPSTQDASEGTQYFTMHPFFTEAVERLLQKGLAAS